MGGARMGKVFRTAWLLSACVTTALTVLALPSAAPAAHNDRITELVSALPDGSPASVGGRVWPNPLMTEDGKRVFFLAGTSIGRQIFERFNGTTTLISTGPSPQPGTTMCAPFSDAPCRFDFSRDGTHVFFVTMQPLVNEDSDTCVGVDSGPGCSDLYERFRGATRLISKGPAGGGPFNVIDGPTVSEDGTRVFFSTQERLLDADADNTPDVYESVDGDLRLFPSAAAAVGETSPIGIDLQGAGRDASRVFFTTTQALVSEDTNNASDRYERTSDGRVVLAADEKQDFFTTDQALVSADTDSCPQYLRPTRGCYDVYERTGNTVKLISTGPNGGNGPFDAGIVGTSSDGKRVFFSTQESLISSDTDSCPQYSGPPQLCYDIYESSGGTPTLVSIGPSGGNGPFDVSFSAISNNGKHIFFTTGESLVASDTDGRYDVYERSANKTTLVSTGPTVGNGPYDAFLNRVSDDGGRVIFQTAESLVPADSDSCPSYDDPQQGCPDIYERFKGSTTLLSTGPSDTGNCDPSYEGQQSLCPTFLAASTDGTRVLFSNGPPLVPAAGDRFGVYMSGVVKPGCRGDKPGHTPAKCGR